MAEKQHIDTWLIRAKDIIIIVAAFLSFAGYGLKLYAIPGIQEAQAKTIVDMKSTLVAHDQDIAVLKSGIYDIKSLLIRKNS